MFKRGGSGEIVYDISSINQKISVLRSSIKALDPAVTTKIEGNNKLEMVESLNEIKRQYDELFAKYETIFMNNIQATETSIVKLQEMDRKVATDIRLK